MNQHAFIAREPAKKDVADPTSRRELLRRFGPGEWVLLIGAMALAVPTLIAVARSSWSTEQGGHGPIVVATGLWLLARERKSVMHLRRPGSPWVFVPMFAGLALLYLFARITGIIEIEGFAMYGVLLTVAYAIVGAPFMRRLWFPLLYLALIFPPPESWIAAITQPIKIWISELAVLLLHGMGYPIASSGVSIQLAQYNLLIAAACAGLNSIISLSAICMFYIYLRHNANYRYFALLMLAVVPVAIFANFVRVIILILLTYHAGEAAAQGFLHDFAGLVMFAVALVTILAIDRVAGPIRARLAKGHS